MIIQGVWRESFDFFRKPVVVEPGETRLSSDAGLLPIRQFDDAIGLTEQFAAALTDLRYQPAVTHTLLEMVRMRVYGILADYPDQNDHDVLRSDPVFKLIAGRSLDAPDLASQPTLSRFENAIDVRSLRRLQDVFIDQFIASFDAPPAQAHARHRPVRRPDARPAAADLLPRLLRAVPVPAAGDHLRRERPGGDDLPAVRHGQRSRWARTTTSSTWRRGSARRGPACGSCCGPTAASACR